MKKIICPNCNGTGIPLNHKKLGTEAGKRRRKLGLSLRKTALMMSDKRPHRIHHQYLYQLEHGTKPWNTELIELNKKVLA